jgi:hypothetical protein
MVRRLATVVGSLLITTGLAAQKATLELQDVERRMLALADWQIGRLED